MTNPNQPGLDAVARTDRFLDALAEGRQTVSGDLTEPGDRELAALLESWRDDLRLLPVTELVSEQQAVAALRSGAVTSRRPRRRLAVIAPLAATVLSLGGFGAVVGAAQPGDALYGLHAMLLGEPKSVHDDRIVLDAKTQFDSVSQMITDGQWDQAQDKLVAVSGNVQNIKDSDRKQDMVDRWKQLNAKVQSRNPNATVSPDAKP